MSNENAKTNANNNTIGALRTTLLGAGVLAMVGLALGAYGITNYLGQVAFHHGEIEHLEQLRADVRFRQRQLIEATEVLPDFQRLQQKGAVGALAKTLEADRFERAATNHPANIRSFAMGGVDSIAAPPDLPFVTLGLGRHELTFVSQPRHEVHLLRLLNELPETLGGLSLLRSCDITRGVGVRRGAQAEGSGDAIVAEGEIRARCAIDWYVFAPSDANASLGSLAGQFQSVEVDEEAR